MIVTASSAMEYAFEGGQLASRIEPTPSVFTGAVVDGLTTGEADRDGDGWVGLTELVGFVTDRVHRVTPNQNPQMWTFGSQGELLIARSRVRRITPPPLAPELLEAWRVRCRRQGSASSTICASGWHGSGSGPGVRRVAGAAADGRTTTAAGLRWPPRRRSRSRTTGDARSFSTSVTDGRRSRRYAWSGPPIALTAVASSSRGLAPGRAGRCDHPGAGAETGSRRP